MQNTITNSIFATKPITLIILSLLAQQAYAQDVNYQATNSVKAITDDKPSTAEAIDIPSVATQYGATKKTLLIAEVKDSKQVGTGKTNNQGKPISNKPVDINP